MSELTGPAATNNMLLPLHLEQLLCASRKWDSDIIDVTGNRKCDRLRVYDVDLDRYGRQPN